MINDEDIVGGETDLVYDDYEEENSEEEVEEKEDHYEEEKDPCQFANCPEFHNCVPDSENLVPHLDYRCEYDAELAKQYCELFCLLYANKNLL